MLKDHLKNLIAVTTVYPAGQKCDAAILEFDCEISNECLTADTFEVKDRRVVRAYTNGSAEKCPEGRNGRFVVLELSLEDEAAAIYILPADDGRHGAVKNALEYRRCVHGRSSDFSGGQNVKLHSKRCSRSTVNLRL